MGVPRFLIGSLAGTLAAPIVLLAACGGDDAPIADPPVSPRPTSSSPTGTPPQESPEAFIRRWFGEGTKMQNTGDTHAYLAMQRGCRDCVAVATRVKRTYSRGGFYRTKGVRSLRVASSRASDGTRSMDIRVNLYPTVYATSVDGVTEHFDGGPAHFQVRLREAKASWLVASFVQVVS
jgi:hypothetical protein